MRVKIRSGTEICFWRALDRTLIHPRYLYYWMYSREFFVQSKGVAGQTDMAEYSEHLAWLLFLKFLDEEEKERLAQAALGEGEHYAPVIQGDLAWDAWAGPDKLGTWNVEDLIQFVRGRLLPGRVYSKELMELFFAQPYVKVKFVVEAGIAERKTAAEYLRALEQIGVLVDEKRGREVIYRHPALLEVLST